jgi:hypothetical protein
MDPIERVKNMVRHTLVVKPDVSNRELLARAKEIAPDAVEGMSLRQFHGKFRLPIVRFEMTPKRAKRNGDGTRGETTGPPARNAKEGQVASSKPKPKPKRGRKKVAAAPDAVNGAVRKVLIDFAVELEKAESRSELVSVIAGVDDFVERIVDVATNAYAKGTAA